MKKVLIGLLIAIVSLFAKDFKMLSLELNVFDTKKLIKCPNYKVVDFGVLKIDDKVYTHTIGTNACIEKNGQLRLITIEMKINNNDINKYMNEHNKNFANASEVLYINYSKFAIENLVTKGYRDSFSPQFSMREYLKKFEEQDSQNKPQ